MALTITRDLQLAIALYTIGVERSRRAYHRDQRIAEMSAAERDRVKQARYYANRRAKKEAQ